MRVTGTALPPTVLLMAKVVCIVFLIRQWHSLPVPFLPFVTGLDQILPGAVAKGILQLTFLGAAMSLLFNYRVRAASFVLGSVILLAVLSSRLYYENNRLFAGCLLFLAGLYSDGIAADLIRYQLVVLYAGAALNKLLEPGWRSGQFFSAWAQTGSFALTYTVVPHWLPGFPAFFGWTAILIEAVLAATLLPRRTVPYAIWLGITYHTGLLLSTGRTFGLFWFVLPVAFLACLRLTNAPIAVVLPRRSRRAMGWHVFRLLDLDHRFRWHEEDQPDFRIQWNDHTCGGLPGVACMLVLNPITYLLFAVLVSPIPDPWTALPGVLVMLVLMGIALHVIVHLGRIRVPFRSPERRVIT